LGKFRYRRVRRCCRGTKCWIKREEDKIDHWAAGEIEVKGPDGTTTWQAAPVEYETSTNSLSGETIKKPKENLLQKQAIAKKIEMAGGEAQKNEGGVGDIVAKSWEMSNAGLTQGATGLLAASILDSTGRLVTGKCTTADGIEVLEPNTIFLDW
jgi:hypothetical protein